MQLHSDNDNHYLNNFFVHHYREIYLWNKSRTLPEIFFHYQDQYEMVCRLVANLAGIKIEISHLYDRQIPLDAISVKVDINRYRYCTPYHNR